jgi:hypothetical protein
MKYYEELRGGIMVTGLNISFFHISVVEIMISLLCTPNTSVSLVQSIFEYEVTLVFIIFESCLIMFKYVGATFCRIHAMYSFAAKQFVCISVYRVPEHETWL